MTYSKQLSYILQKGLMSQPPTDQLGPTTKASYLPPPLSGSKLTFLRYKNAIITTL